MELLLPFQLPFMQNAFLICLIVAFPTALLSCFLVLKGWSLMGDAVSHAVLPGVVLAYLIGLPLLLGAFFAGLFCAVATGFISENSRVKNDTVLGVVFSGMFGIGIVMFAAVQTDQHLDHILFGNILGVGPEDLWVAGTIAAAVCAFILFFRKDLLLFTFDPVQASAVGLRSGVLHYGLLVCLSLTVVATLSSVGIILAIGLLITPGATAFLITRRFEQMMIVATLVALIGLLLGTYLSFWLNSAPAPTAILAMSLFFVMAFALKAHRLRFVSSK